MDNFTPVAATFGGLLIGLSAVMLMLFNGRISGISGIASGALLGERSDRWWRVCFVAGLVLAPLLLQGAVGITPRFEMTDNIWVIIAAGLLVGFGTRLGSGCTSGHGICGLSRLSPRSLVSVLVFMAAGVLTATFVRPLIGG
jgi:uncharacterized membrane protein YedE/YeeE